MSLKAFHFVFLAASLLLLGFTSAWSLGFNPAGVTAPWALKASLAGLALTAPYAWWFLRRSREWR